MAAVAFDPRFEEVYRRLLKYFGPRHWWPADSPMEMMLGAILTQGVAWRNVEKALSQLQALTQFAPGRLAELSDEQLHAALRPTRFYRAKAKKVRAFVGHLLATYDGDVARFLGRPPLALRDELLSIHGIGEETADDILVYAAKQPSFVIDAYTRRIMSRLELAPSTEGYGAWQRHFAARVPADAALYGEFHAQLDALGHHLCLPRTPRCSQCPLHGCCRFAAACTVGHARGGGGSDGPAEESTRQEDVQGASAAAGGGNRTGTPKK